jgi:hypothetical protein
LGKIYTDEVDFAPQHPTEDYPYGFYTEERLLHSLMDHKKRTATTTTTTTAAACGQVVEGLVELNLT